MTEAPTDTHKIIIADDDQEILELISTTLSAGGFEVSQFENGTDALAAINDEKPDLVILDITMPGLTGLEVLEKMKTNLATAKIPVVFLTADGDQHSRLRGLKGGAVEYFDKPFDAVMLRRRIERILWKAENEPEA